MSRPFSRAQSRGNKLGYYRSYQACGKKGLGARSPRTEILLLTLRTDHCRKRKIRCLVLTPNAGTCVQCGKLGRRCIIATVDCIAELTKMADASNGTSHAAHYEPNGKGGISVSSHNPERLSVRAGDKTISALSFGISSIHQCRTGSSSEPVHGASTPQLNDGLTPFNPMRVQTQSSVDHDDFLQWDLFGTQEEVTLPFTFDTFNPYVEPVEINCLWNSSQVAVERPYYLPADDLCQPTTPPVNCPPRSIGRCPQRWKPIPDDRRQLSRAPNTELNLSEN